MGTNLSSLNNYRTSSYLNNGRYLVLDFISPEIVLMKSSRKVLLAITLYSLTVYTFLMWLYFGFMNKFYSQHKIHYIREFRAEGGHYIVLTFFIMLVILTIAFIAYAFYDSKLISAYGQDEVSLHSKNNLFSLERIIQYAILISGIFYFSRTTVLAFSLDGALAFAELASTMAILIMYEFQLIYFTIFNILIIISFIKNFNSLYY